MDPLDVADIALVRAGNPGPFTLEGTNTWLIGRDPCWVVDPGPPALEPHVEHVAAEAATRGGIGGIALTHAHADHAGAVAALLEIAGDVPVAAATWEHASVHLNDGDSFGPLTALATPGHSTDHLAFLSGGALLSGDAVLGRGSVFVFPDPGALSGYLAALERLLALPIEIICPGHGPLVLDPQAVIRGYRAHRLEREEKLVRALDAGLRSADELLDEVWSDAPPSLRGAAMVTLAAHLDKLGEDGRLPPGVERPELDLYRPRSSS